MFPVSWEVAHASLNNAYDAEEEWKWQKQVSPKHKEKPLVLAMAQV